MPEPTENEKKPHVLVRRLGDIVQAITAALIIAGIIGLFTTLVELRDEVRQNRVSIDLQDAIYASQISSLTTNLTLQMGVVEEMVRRMTTGGYNAAQGKALEDALSDLRRFVNEHAHTEGHIGMLQWKSAMVVRMERLERECEKRIVGQAVIGDQKK